MIQSVILTSLIIAINVVFFSFGLDDTIRGYSYSSKEFLQTIYKVIAYIIPMILVLYFYDKKHIRTEFKGKFFRYNKPRIYIVRFLRGAILLLRTQSTKVSYGTYTVFYVLIVNSLVEESVFRGYIQTKLVNAYGKVKGIIGQAVLFGLVHLPFYYTLYQGGLYDTMNETIGGILGIDGIGAFIVLFSLGTPILLGLIRGWTTNKTKSLRPAIVWHSLHNGILLFA